MPIQFCIAPRRMLMRSIIVVAALGSGVATAAGGLNDTGITFCGDANSNSANCVDPNVFPRQDGRYGRDARAAAGTLSKTGGGGKGFDFSKIANDGRVLLESATLGSGSADWACTRDNVTGLIWEVKATSGLRSQEHRYTWYNSNGASNGGNAGTANGGTCATAGRCDTEKFVADVNTAGLCGAHDWRLPKVKELEGIVDYGRAFPAIDPTYFPNTPGGYFWTGSPYAANSEVAWDLGFDYGYVYQDYRSNAIHVRLVRTGP